MSHETIDYVEIIDRLKDLRNESGLSVRSLALVTGLNVSTLTKYLNKDLRITTYKTAFLLDETASTLSYFLEKKLLPMPANSSRLLLGHKLKHMQECLTKRMELRDANVGHDIIDFDLNSFMDELVKRERKYTHPKPAQRKFYFYFYLDDADEMEICHEFLRRTEVSSADGMMRRTLILSALKEYFVNHP